MLKIRNYALIILSILFITNELSGQNNTSSPYTRFGIGDINRAGTGRSIGMGGLGIGSLSRGYLNNINPASYSAIPQQRFIMEFGVDFFVSQFQTTTQKQTNRDMNIQYIAIGFPVLNWWHSSIGIVPYSNVGYSISDETNSSTMGYIQTEYIGMGGLNRFYIANSFSFKGLSLGVNLSYLFGALQKNSYSLVENDDVKSILSVKQQTNLGDIQFSFGAQYTDSIGSDTEFTIGAIFENQQDLSVKQTKFALRNVYIGGRMAVDTIQNEVRKDGNITLPLSWGAGFEFRKNNKWSFGFDYYRQDWQNVSYLSENQTVSTSEQYTFGVELIPNYRSFHYLEVIRYRLGGHFGDSYYNIDGASIKEFGMSFGLGLPLRKSSTMINLAMEYSQRGTTDNNLIREDYFTFSVNLTLGDIWFIKRKFD